MIFNNTILRILLYLYIFLFIPYNSNAQDIFGSLSPSKYEVRAVWLTTIGGLDWPHNYASDVSSIYKQKKELTTMLDKLQHAGINTVLFQTRIRGTVIYPSSIEPWDNCCSGMSGRSPGYDPLAFAINECHRRGMEIQAWVVTFPLGKWNSFGCKTLRRKHPDMVIKKGNDGFIDPANPLAADYLASICYEIANKYDIDGIHLDYIRYPETWTMKDSFKEQARKNITAIVRSIHDKVKKIKPWVKLSCSPIGKYKDLNRYSSLGWNAWYKGCQPAQQWLKDGLMDQLFPMIYFRGNNFYPFLLDWIENVGSDRIVPGLGIYFLSSNEGNWPLQEIVRQMNVSHSLGTGYAFFRAKFLCDNIKGLYQFTTNHIATYPTLTHNICYNENKSIPEAPTNLTIKHNDGYDVLSWHSPQNKSEEDLTFNVYSSRTFPININDPHNLILTRISQNEIQIRTNQHYYYAVTTINRYGEESCAIESERPNKQYIHNNFQDNINLNQCIGLIDADVIVIENLRGKIVSTFSLKNKNISIDHLKKGAYIVKSINKHNVRHIIGKFVKK